MFQESLAGTLVTIPTHVPFGCYPVRIATRTNANEVQLTLVGTVADVNYLVLIRTNKIHGYWRQLAWAFGAQNTNTTIVRLPIHSLPADAILAAGSGEDTDGDGLPDVYEDLATRTDPLNGNTGDIGIGDGYRDPDGDGWTNIQECQNGTGPGPIIQIVPASSDSEGIRKTIRKVACVPTKDGFSLTVAQCRTNALYLLLAKDGSNSVWKASGFFTGSTNVTRLETDKNGMLFSAGCPLALSSVKFVPTLAYPEFIAGSGEDGDGDGLPDIYELLVTKTNPDSADTGSTGVFDGYKNPAGDGWTNLEKYRRRISPFIPAIAPKPIELTQPTLLGIMKASGQMRQTDLQFEVTLEVRNFKTAEKYHIPSKTMPMANPHMVETSVLTNLQFRITAQVPVKKARPHTSGGP